MSGDSIVITGAREHNLKDITVAIPRDRLTVITGLSGSGKSSLAFDTLYAEGQRRYVESLSAYARQFLDQLQKPEVDSIEGLSPAISIEQRVASANPRSIVATSTEIHDYFRLLFASVGKAHCPGCGKPVGRQSAEQIVERILEFPTRARVMLLAPLVRGRKGQHEEAFEAARKAGFVRVRLDGEIHEIDAVPRLDQRKRHTVEAVVDRLVMSDDIRTRLTDSVETALKQGNGILIAMVQEAGGEWDETILSEKHACIECGISFDELKPRSFSFNSPYGACPTCGGLGTELVFDEDLIVPDRSVSLADGAVFAWRKAGRRLITHYKRLIRNVAKHYDVDTDLPYDQLAEDFRRTLLYGSGDEEIELGHWRGGTYRRSKKVFEGVIPNLQRRLDTTDSDYTKQRLRKFMNRQVCSACHGERLRPEALACTVGGKPIIEVLRFSIRDAAAFFEGLTLSEQEELIAREILKEVNHRLRFLLEVGLDYLTLDRESGTLSGGEMQRIRLATQIGSGLVGVLYVLDEPTIGLHQRDNQRLICTLKELRDLGNTVVVVEHDEQTIREADHVVDLGPGAGKAGGEVIHSGTVEELLDNGESLTARYLGREESVALPADRKKPERAWLEVAGAGHNNLRDIDVRFPVGLLTCVTGVSGSGKSSLVDETLRRALCRRLYGSKDQPGRHRAIKGAEHFDKVVVIDQAPIGRTPRSNPATYTGAFSHIRDHFARIPAAKVRGYASGRFSFNVKGGRCETCKGDGLLRLEMHFLPDVYVTCEQCAGSRYNRETLEIHYHGKSIADVLAMTVDEASEFFASIPAIARRLTTLTEVGLGYLQLGQSATTLSGGEAQRIKLSAELSKTSTGKTLYLLDEPTTGLHFADTHRLLDVLRRLRDASNTVIVIEHNLDVLKSADYIIDLGPGGGDEGGAIVATGTPEEIVACESSHTGRYLGEVLQ